MRIARSIFSAIILCGLGLAIAQNAATPKPEVPKPPDKKSVPPKVPAKKTPAPAAKVEEPARILQLKGMDPALMDKSIDPCVDFYQYSCGGWLKQNPVPADQASYGRDTELAERNRLILRDILEKAAAERPDRSATEQKIGDYYATCMDEEAIEKKGAAALKPELDRIAALKSKDELAEELAHLHLMNVNAFFNYGSDQDFKDATSVIAEADQGGIGLPERDYYIRKDANSVKTRTQYVRHVSNMLRLVGETPAAAAQHARSIMALETSLAKASLTVTQRRDPASVYHKMPFSDLVAINPTFAWNRYARATDTPPVPSLNVAVPDFFKGLETVLKQQPLPMIKIYLRWHLVHSFAGMLPKAFVNENFDFYGKKLSGQKELRARWKRCVQSTDANLGEALGQIYVERTFGAEGKARTLQMVKDIEASMEHDIKQLNWMTDTTKQKALEKLHTVANKIGYPDKWRDYSKYEVVRGDAMGNFIRGAEFESHRQIAKIGKPVDRGEWGMTPPTVNAYYNPQMNDINFPAGILQPPFYDNKMDDAVNYGDAGGIIGHELTHGFDDEGRQFDKEGNLKDWWTAEDAKAFEQRAQCLVDEYNSFVVTDDVHLNGKLTLGENTADNGGLRIANMALQSALAGKPQEKIDGFTPEQRLFLGWGQIWCQNQTDQSARLQATTNEHSTGKYRVNGVVRNMPEFQKAWGCKAGQPMVPENACRVW